MSSGVTFAFTPQYFDDICSDLGQFPLAAAVAASTAVPVALTPITLKNYRGEVLEEGSAEDGGGLADNLGLRSLDEAVFSVNPPFRSTRN
jgi:NTE family protein